MIFARKNTRKTDRTLPGKQVEKVYRVKEIKTYFGELHFWKFSRLPTIRCGSKLEEIKLEPSRTFLYSPETWISAGKPYV